MLAVAILPFFNAIQHYTNYYNAGWITVIFFMSISIVAVIFVEETYGKDLDFVEK